MTEIVKPDQALARRVAPGVHRFATRKVVALLFGCALVAAVVALLAGPLLLWVYNVERAGMQMDAGLAWPEPRQIDSHPRIQDNRALDAALGHLAAAVRWRPDHPHAYRLIGQIYAAREDWERSAAAFEQARSLAPGNPLPAWEAGLSYEQMWRVVETTPADALVEHLAAGRVEAPPQPLETPFCRAGQPETCHAGKTVFTESYAEFPEGVPVQAPVLFLHPSAKVRQTVTVPPERPALRFLLGLAPEAQGWGTDGAVFQVWIEPSSGPAALVYERAIDGPTAVRGWVPGWADLSPWAGQQVTLVLGAAPGPAGNASGDWFGWGDVALTSVEAARFAALAPRARARAAWQAAGFTSAQFVTRGQEAAKAQEFEEALVWYRRAEVMDPWSPDPWYYSGLAHQSLRQWEQAAAAFEKALQFAPGFRDAWYALGQVHASRSEWGAALAAYERGLEGHSGEIGLSLFHYQIGRIRHSLQSPPDPDGAWEAYEQALAVDRFAPQPALKADTYYQRGRLLAAREQWDDAVQEFERALELNGRHYLAHLALASALRKLGRSEEAVTVARRAVELQPDRKDAYRLLGDLYRAEGRAEEARAMYEKVLDLDPQDEAARKALEALP